MRAPAGEAATKGTMRQAVWSSALVLLLAALSGCALWQPPSPRVSLVAVTLLQAGMLAQAYRLRLRLHNPAGAVLKVRRLHYRVRLAGVPFASGTAHVSLTLPAGGTARVRLATRTHLRGFVGRLSLRARKGPPPYPLAYVLSGRLVLAGRAAPVEFARRGEAKVYP